MKKLSPHAACAKAIRTELKQHFPSVKFSVTSDSFSMGNSVDISWTDGPTSEQVNAITKKYQYGSFDGMTDSYNNTNNRDDIPQAKYVHTSRQIRDYYFTEYFEHIKKNYKNCDHLTDLDQSDQLLNSYWHAWTARNLIYRILNKVDLTNGLIIQD